MAMTWSSWLLPNVLLYYIGLVILINYGKATDVCKNHNYTVISDARRSTKNAYNATRGDKLLCDRTKIKESVWYRFELVDGNQLPTTRPEPSYCGTTVPIWMNGSHPSVADGIVERQACAHVSGRFPFGCGYSYIIKVLNCNGFYIYQLKPPKNCHIAYCVASNQTSHPTDSPDIDECAQSPRVCHRLANCSNVPGSFSCLCKSGFEGEGKFNCTDINECVQSPRACHSQAYCTNAPGSFSCHCKFGFTGDGKFNCTGKKTCKNTETKTLNQTSTQG